MTTDMNATPADQSAAGAVVFGLVSLAVCWWFPFGPLVGAVGVALGAFGWCAGTDRTRAVVGTALAACGAGAGLLLAWEYWRRVLAV